MKRVAKKIVLSVSVGAISLGSSLWASSSSSEESEEKRASPKRRSFPSLLYKRKDAELNLSNRVTALQQKAQDDHIKAEEAFDEPVPVMPTYPPIVTDVEMAWRKNLESSRLETLSSSSKSIVEEKEATSPKMGRHSVKKTHSLQEPKDSVTSDSPKAGCRRTGSKTKKEGIELLKELLPSSAEIVGKSPLATSSKIEVLEENENHGPLMEVTISSKIVSAPSELSYDEVKELMAVTLTNKKIELGFGSTLSGDVAAEKKDIQGGKASHKLPEMGAQRIKRLLENYPDARAQLIIDEKREYHTLKADGYKGVVGHYKLIIPTEEGGFETLDGSSFSIAFAVLR